jgi:hypothetical protein
MWNICSEKQLFLIADNLDSEDLLRVVMQSAGFPFFHLVPVRFRGRSLF